MAIPFLAPAVGAGVRWAAPHIGRAAASGAQAVGRGVQRVVGGGTPAQTAGRAATAVGTGGVAAVATNNNRQASAPTNTGNQNPGPLPSGTGGAGQSQGSGGGGSWGGSWGSAPSYDPAQLSLLDQAIGTIQDQINRLGGQLQSAYGNIDSSYNTRRNELQGSFDRGQQQYGQNTTQNRQRFVSDRNNITDRGAQGLQGIQRILGAGGAGGSSVAMHTAPGAVASEVARERAGAGREYAENQRNLDTSWQEFEGEIDDERRRASDWRGQQRQQAQQNRFSTEQDLQTRLADVQTQRAGLMGGNVGVAGQDALSRARSLSSRIDALGRFNPTYDGRQVQIDMPTLSSYQMGDAPGVIVEGPSTGHRNPNPNIALIDEEER